MKTAALLIVAVAVATLAPGRSHASDADVPGYSLRFVPDRIAAGEDHAARVPVWEQRAAGSSDNSTAGRAVLLSLLLPGAGDYYLGNRRRAAYFFTAEAAIWTGFVVSRIQGRRREDAYKEYAVTFAGVDGTGHSDDFYAEIRQYDSSDDYEAEIKMEGRVELYPDASYERMEQYYLENRVADFTEWQWRSFEDRVHFQHLRSDSKTAYRRATWMLWGAVANRIASAIATMVTLRGVDDESEMGARYRLDFAPPTVDFDAGVTLTRRF